MALFQDHIKNYPALTVIARSQILWFIFITLLWLGFLFLSPLDLDYTAGELLDHFFHWSETGTLYPPIDHPPFRVLNYPPLFLALVQLFSTWVNTPLFWGRLINVLAFLTTLWLAYGWLRREKLSPLAALAFLSFLGGSYPVLYSLGQFHLEFLGIALSLGGLYLIYTSRTWPSLLASGILLALACWAKQVQVVPALVAWLWLLRYRRRDLPLVSAGILLVAVLGGLWINAYFGEEAWRHLLSYTVGTFSLRQFSLQLGAYLLPWILFFAGALALGFYSRSGRQKLTWWYFIGMSLWLFSTARTGAGDQYFIEWSFSLLLWLGPALMMLVQRQQSPINIWKSPWALLLIFQILTADLLTGGLLYFESAKLTKRLSQLNEVCSFFPEAPIMVPSENPALVRYCGGIPALHPFIMANLNARGLWDDRRLIKLIERGDYPMILLPFDPKGSPPGYHRERWTPNTLEAMKKYYKITLVLDGLNVLSPKDQTLPMIPPH